MKNILHVSSPNDYARYLGAPVLHPLVSVIHYDEVSPIRSSLNRYGVYGLFIQRNFPKNLTYGMKMFDAADGLSSPASSAGRKTTGKASTSAAGFCCSRRNSCTERTWKPA